MTKHPLIDELVARRIQLGLSQRALARRIFKSPRAVCHFENDPGSRHLAAVDEVARGLGMRLALVPIEDDGRRRD